MAEGAWLRGTRQSGGRVADMREDKMPCAAQSCAKASTKELGGAEWALKKCGGGAEVPYSTFAALSYTTALAAASCRSFAGMGGQRDTGLHK